MKNVLMQVCKAMHRYTERQIADKLGMTPEEYIDLETSAATMTPAQAEQLAAIYNISAEYFLESSQQLELLLARAEVILNLQAQNERLQLENLRYKKFVEVTHVMLQTMPTEKEIEELMTKIKSIGYEQETTRQ